MLNALSIRSRIVRSKAAVIADVYEMDTGGGTWAIDANGFSATSGTSDIALCLVGGFNDQKITASLTSTTAGASATLGVMARFRTNITGSATYYYLRQNAGTLRLQKVVNGTFTTLASGAFTFTPGTWYTFTLQCVGTAISGSIDDGAGNSLELSAVDSAIEGPGVMGFRSGPTTASQISCRSWTCEEV